MRKNEHPPKNLLKVLKEYFIPEVEDFDYDKKISKYK